MSLRKRSMKKWMTRNIEEAKLTQAAQGRRQLVRLN